MDRMTDSGSVGWAFESPRGHNFFAVFTGYLIGDFEFFPRIYRTMKPLV